MFDELLARIARALDSRGIPYMVIGGQAVLVYGEPRLTRDIDLTLGVDVDALDTVLEATAQAGLRPLVDPADFVPRTMVLPCQDPATSIRVDLVFSFTPYEQEAIARSRAMSVAGTEVRYASPEDLVVHKLLAGRPRDLEDVRSILVRQSGLDHGYLRGVLRDLGALLDRDLLSQLDAVLGAP